MKRFPNSEKNALLRELLPLLGSRGIVRDWANSPSPYTDLEQECTAISQDPNHQQLFKSYFEENRRILQTVDTFLSNYSVAAHAKADKIPWPERLLAKQGVWIIRWLPTFLVIDGPLGKLLRSSNSPLHALLRSSHGKFPILAQGRDLFNNNLFRLVRNGVAHWAFVFEGQGEHERLICFDWENGEKTAEISILEAEAFNMSSFSIIECLDQSIFKLASRSAG